MRIVVNPVLCQSHGVCTEEEAPEIFTVGGTKTVEVKQPIPPAEQLDAVRNAIKYCPTGALSLVED
ncbi:MAG: ferredoxin [Deltaproteobacteria bacterium]|nr:ferredoxin [Deltaproteobacteria bacterium]